MSKPSNSIKKVKLPNNTECEIVPDKVGSGTYVASLPSLSADDTLVVQSKVATSNSAGLVKPDGTTTSVDANGVLSVIGGGGGSVDIDNTSITENSSNKIQAVGVIDQKTGNANKQWTGTKEQYNALPAHDADTIYNITNDNRINGSLISSGSQSSSASTLTITKTLADGVYDLYMNGTTSTNLDLYLLPNNDTRNVNGNHWQSYGSTTPAGYSGSLAGCYLGTGGTSYFIIHVVIAIQNGIVTFEFNSVGRSTDTTYRRNGMYYGDGYGTITSLVISTKNSGNINSGFTYYLYKRG